MWFYLTAEWVQCDICYLWFCARCAPPGTYDIYQAWKCPPCMGEQFIDHEGFEPTYIWYIYENKLTRIRRTKTNKVDVMCDFQVTRNVYEYPVWPLKFWLVLCEVQYWSFSPIFINFRQVEKSNIGLLSNSYQITRIYNEGAFHFYMWFLRN